VTDTWEKLKRVCTSEWQTRQSIFTCRTNWSDRCGNVAWGHSSNLDWPSCLHVQNRGRLGDGLVEIGVFDDDLGLVVFTWRTKVVSEMSWWNLAFSMILFTHTWKTTSPPHPRSHTLTSFGFNSFLWVWPGLQPHTDCMFTRVTQWIWGQRNFRFPRFRV
jgi:hypothetical protein